MPAVTPHPPLPPPPQMAARTVVHPVGHRVSARASAAALTTACSLLVMPESILAATQTAVHASIAMRRGQSSFHCARHTLNRPRTTERVAPAPPGLHHHGHHHACAPTPHGPRVDTDTPRHSLNRIRLPSELFSIRCFEWCEAHRDESSCWMRFTPAEPRTAGSQSLRPHVPATLEPRSLPGHRLASWDRSEKSQPLRVIPSRFVSSSV